MFVRTLYNNLKSGGCGLSLAQKIHTYIYECKGYYTHFSIFIIHRPKTRVKLFPCYFLYLKQRSVKNNIIYLKNDLIFIQKALKVNGRSFFIDSTISFLSFSNSSPILGFTLCQIQVFQVFLSQSRIFWKKAKLFCQDVFKASKMAFRAVLPTVPNLFQGIWRSRQCSVLGKNRTRNRYG